MVTGYQTAMKRAKLSAPMRYLSGEGLLKGTRLDFGCGRGLDADLLGMHRYDPHWHPEEHWLLDHYDTVTCNYVLNVLDPREQDQVVVRVVNMLAPEGVAYFSVRRDLPVEGQPGRGCYQHWVDLEQSHGMTKVIENSTYAIFKFDNARNC